MKKIDPMKLHKVLLVLICVFMNYAGRRLALWLSLPLWLDVMGTMIAAYVLGPVSGALVGLTNNLINSLWEPTMLYYAVVSVCIGLLTGYAGRKRYIRTPLMAMTVAVSITFLAVLISTPISLLLGEKSGGNIWGDGVRDYLIENHIPRIPATFVGNLYVDFLDKTVSVLVLYVLIILHGRIEKRRKKPEVLLLLLPLLFGSLKLDARADDGDSSWIQTVFSGDNGLPCGHANDVEEDGNGVLWIATYAGLYRYNGSEFRYMNELSEVKNANCLYVDTEGRVWIGTNDSGVAVMINERIVNNYGTADGLPSESIRCICRNVDGNYYVGTADGLTILRLDNGIRASGVLPETGYVSGLAANGDGAVAGVNAEGTLFLLRDEKLVARLDDESYSCVCFGREGELYAGTTEGGIRIFSVGETLERTGSLSCPGLSKLNRIRIYSDGELWLCADNGVGHFSKDGRFERPETGEFNYSIENMCMDYQGNLWFASSRQGLLRLSSSPFTDLYAQQGLAGTVANTTAFWKGCLYAGTDDGLDILDPRDTGKKTDTLTELLSGSRVRCLAVDNQDRLWIASYGQGLICAERSGAYRCFDECGSRVRVCRILGDGSVAASGSEGLFFIAADGTVSSVPYGDELGNANILCMEEERDGTILAGTDGNGILRIKDGKVISHLDASSGLPSNVILRIVKDKAGNGYFVVTSNSLCYMDGERVRAFDAFPYSNNYDVIADSDGELFIYGSSGVYVVDREELMSGRRPEYQLLDSRMGLMGSLTANAWCEYTGGKELYLCTDRGVFKVNTDAYRSPARSYRLRVKEMRLDEKVVSIERGRTSQIPRDVIRIELVPEVVNYTLEDPEISYRLEGLENEWITVPQSELTTVAYTNLPVGDYIFHLAILDPESGKPMEESYYSFTREAAIYDHSWFRAYMILVGGLFVGWLTAYITRRRMQGTLRMQQERLDMIIRQEQMSSETIMAIAATVDAKDERTSQHSKRVSEYSVLIAKEYGFKTEEQENLRKAALLHDIGKVGIPDAILNKPARLTDDEYAVMKTHVTRGADILKGLNSIDHVVEGARFHHERFDGKGYPDGLKGDEIPLYGRIIAIADAFDAMTANRVYRKKQDFSYVLDELKNNRGKQFDPVLLDIFLKLIDDKVIDVEALYGGKEEKDEK
ncbi:MAG: HD domain-containing protein [Lachnospiraceae bacterium]|nr:HD domain-containing protein [Lachnospiraceae bacterium]